MSRSGFDSGRGSYLRQVSLQLIAYVDPALIGVPGCQTIGELAFWGHGDVVVWRINVSYVHGLAQESGNYRQLAPTRWQLPL